MINRQKYENSHNKHSNTQQSKLDIQEVIPCVNINIMLNKQVYCTTNRELLTPTTSNTQTIYSTLTSTQKDIVTLQIKQREKAKEINICLSYAWLKQHGMSDHEHRTLFHEKKKLRQWQATKEQVQLAKDLIQLENTTNQSALIDKLTREYKSFYFISVLLNSLFDSTNTTTITPFDTVPSSAPISSTASYTIESKQNALLIQRIKETISLNISNPLTLEQLAKSHNISISTLQRRFKYCCGTTVNEYIRALRLEYAKTAIIEGKSIGEAAYMAGYNHSSNFITAFKKQFNATPKELIQIKNIASLITIDS